MEPWYAVEERERQIAVLRQSWRKRQRRAKQHPHPKSLLMSLKEPSIVLPQSIRRLAEGEYTNPVVSLYLQLNPEKLVPEEKGPVRCFHSLKNSAFAKHREFIEGLPRPQRESLDHDMEEIETFLAEHFVPTKLRSVIIFKAGGALNWIVGLPVRTADNLVIDPDPYILPLEAILEENERVLFVEISKGESHFLVYHLGYSREVDRIKSFVPTDTVDASVPGRVQRHRLTHLQRHLKLTAKQAFRLYSDWSCQVLVLMGEKRVSHLLEGFLHPTLKEKIISRIYGAPDADTRDRKELIENALHAHKADRETQAIEDVSRHNPDVVASVLRRVVEVCNLFLVRKLLISESLHQKGSVCKEHHYISLDETECPFCHARLLPVENVVDEIVEIARLHGVDVTIIEYRQELMAKYDGIAAVTYVPASLT
jgi:release factor family 10